MPRLVIATSASDTPMGAQHYQEAIAERAAPSLGRVSDQQWRVDRLIARSLRSHLPGTHRLPMGRLRHAGLRERTAMGRIVYPRGALVHRMDLNLPPAPGPQVITLHDVVAWRYPDEERPARAAAEELRRADVVVCVSQFTAQEAAEMLGLRNTVVVPNGVDDRFLQAQPLSSVGLEQMGIRPPFVLYAGGSAERKNLSGLAGAWGLLSTQFPDTELVLAGPRSAARDNLFRGLSRVNHLGRVGDDELPGIMAAATAVVVPSLYEGFGLPALEALAVGTPLVCAETSSLPEVVGDCAVLVEPTPAGLAGGLEAVLDDPREMTATVARGRKRAAQFTWEASADSHARVWDALR